MKKLPHTPNNQIKSALRQLSLRSRERAATVKRDNNTCQKCGVKGSKAKGKEVKTTVHHINGVKWTKIIEFIRKELLVNPDKMIVLCEDCHKEGHKDE